MSKVEPSQAVPSYRILFLRGGRLLRTQMIEAENDLSAMEAASRLQGSGDLELWRDDQRLARFRSASNEILKTASR